MGNGRRAGHWRDGLAYCRVAVSVWRLAFIRLVGAASAGVTETTQRSKLCLSEHSRMSLRFKVFYSET
jgi:hypothetical protein